MLGILTAAVLVMVLAVVSGAYLTPFLSSSPGRSTVGTLACTTAFIGWVSWPVIWWTGPAISGPIINITFLLAATARP